MDENKIPQKGTLGGASPNIPNKNVSFGIPQKKATSPSSGGIVFDVPKKVLMSSTVKDDLFDPPKKQKTPTSNEIMKKAHLPEPSKTLEPTIDLATISTFNNPDEPNIKNAFVPRRPTTFPKPLEAAKQPVVPQKAPYDEFTSPVGTPAVIPTESPETKTDLPNLRTYKKDVAGAIKDQKTSLVRMVLEEQKGRLKREMEESPRSRKNLPLILLSIVFFLATSLIIYYTFFHQSKEQQLISEINLTPLINTETIQEIPINGRAVKDISKEIRQEIEIARPKLDTIKYFFFTETISTQTESGLIEQKKLVGSRKVFEKLEIIIPPVILRTIKNEFMFGYHAFNRNQPFLILKTDYYDNAFVGMLEWESTMARNLRPLFGSIGTEDLSQRAWSDVVTKNKDTRSLNNFDGSIALVYMFKDQRTLIITTNNDTLFEVSRRLDLSLKKKGE